MLYMFIKQIKIEALFYEAVFERLGKLKKKKETKLCIVLMLKFSICAFSSYSSESLCVPGG